MNQTDGQIDPVDDIYYNTDSLVEMAKLRISFWEKLVVLNATVVGASFTATALLKDRLVGDAGVGYLVAAWKLLFGGIVLCLIAQFLLFPALDYALRHQYGMRVFSILARQQTTAPLERQMMEEIRTAAPELQKKSDIIARMANAVGSVGFLESVAAYYWLYRFLQINVHSR
jgi:hypothetical protein